MGNCCTLKKNKKNNKPKITISELSNNFKTTNCVTSSTPQNTNHIPHSSSLLANSKSSESLSQSSYFFQDNSLSPNIIHESPSKLRELSKSENHRDPKAKSKSFIKSKQNFYEHRQSVSSVNNFKISFSEEVLLINEKPSETNKSNLEQSLIHSKESKHFIDHFYQSNLKKTNRWKQNQKGPKRLTQYTDGRNLVPVADLEIENAQNNKDEESSDEGLLAVPSAFQDLTRNSKKHILNRSIVSKELEFLELENDGTMVLIFYVPFMKNISDKPDYRLTQTSFENFECFYKTNAVYGSEQEKVKIIQKFPNKWQDGIVPYFIEKSLIFAISKKNQTLYNVIINAIEQIEKKTVVRFVVYSAEKHSNYLSFSLSDKNSSLVGFHSGKNSIFLNKNADQGVVLHEIMHVLGFMHEYKKKNGERFYYLSSDQVFSATKPSESLNICLSGLNFGPFDYESVMHYNSCEHMIAYRNNIESDEVNLSSVDIAKINCFYSGVESDEEMKNKIDDIEKIANMSNIKSNRRRSVCMRLIISDD